MKLNVFRRLDRIFSPMTGAVRQLELLFNIIRAYRSEGKRSSADTPDEMVEWQIRAFRRFNINTQTGCYCYLLRTYLQFLVGYG